MTAVGLDDSALLKGTAASLRDEKNPMGNYATAACKNGNERSRKDWEAVGRGESRGVYICTVYAGCMRAKEGKKTVKWIND